MSSAGTKQVAGSDGARGNPIEGVARIIAVSSAKGGVGKSTVAANLASALLSLGNAVGLVDVDIYGPSAPIMLGIKELPEPDRERNLMKPVRAHGLSVMSMGFFLDDNAPVIWRGPMVMSATRQFIRGVDWGKLDWLVVDLPPGTGDIVLSLTQEVALDGAVVVTTPQDIALDDVRRGIAMFRRVNTPVLGLVDNMAGLVCPNCGKRDDVFGERSAEALVQELGVGLLAEFPLYPEIRVAGDEGTPIVLSDPQHPASKTYLELAASVSRAVDDLRSDMHGPEPTNVEHDSSDSRVKISWSDGVETSYSLTGLRGWCPCAQCQGHSGRIAFAEPEGEVALDSFEGVGRYAIRFLWKGGHSTGMYSYSWLREIADFPECR